MDPSAGDRKWTERFQAVCRAQGRYMYLLLLSMILFWSIHVQVENPEFFNAVWLRVTVPVFGVMMSSLVVWACSPAVIGILLLATLGTFRAVRTAWMSIHPDGDGEDSFERLDLSPNAIDFIVYGSEKPSRLQPLALLSYPAFLTLAYYEAVHIWLHVLVTDLVIPGRAAIMTVGALTLIWSLPKLATLWYGKGSSMVKLFRGKPA